MKLIVQIPCLNEAEALAATIADIPRYIEGVGEVEIMLIDDGSIDDSVAVARASGADHIIRHSHNKGLAETFRTGVSAALKLGADIIVNFDGDGQYRGEEIAALIRPLLENRCDIVVGDRQIHQLPSYTPYKRIIHGVGRFVVNRLSGLRISDPVSGFRAFSRHAARELIIYSAFSYTTETLIQAGNHRLRVGEVPVHTNPTPRPSRLFRSVRHFVLRTAVTIMQTYAMYRPLKVFATFSVALMLIGMIPIFRFLYIYFIEGGAGHVQSLILGSTFIIMGCVALMFAILADVQARNRQLLEQMRRQLMQMEDELRRR